MERWTAEAGKAASARGLSRPELINVMPGFLAALADDEPLPKIRARFEAHIADRIRLGFDLAEMIDEFALLERCVEAVLEGLPQEERPSSQESRRLFATLRDTVVAVTEVFQEHMRLDEQGEKRAVRRLQVLSDEGLHDPSAPMGARLREAMEIVREAMGTDSAAILLYEPETKRLVMEASVGTAEAALAQFANHLGLSSFAGQIAASEEPVFVLDAATTELEISEPLRQSGIHSLLGVKLPARRRLLGVMYVGLCEKRGFCGREINRLEMLGDRLSLHLDNAQLYEERQRRIDELSAERKIREQFVAILAHDLRGPLSAAHMQAQMMVYAPGQADQGAVLRILRNLDRADRMVRDLLDVSRVHAGKRLPLNLGPCDLRAVAQEVVEEVRGAHGDRFDLVAEEAVLGYWSGDELRRALWNLMVNAAKYGAKSSRITVRLERLSDQARVSVHNMGNPIPESELGAVFEAFTRSEGAPRTAGAWGLGLALVRACAEAHGGTVAVQSSAEGGTTFMITLPLDSRPFEQAR